MLSTKFTKVAQKCIPLTRAAFVTQRLTQQTVMQAQMGMLQMQQFRNFSSFDLIEKASQKLDKAVEGEIKYE